MLDGTLALMVRSLRTETRALLPHLMRFFLVAVIFWALAMAHLNQFSFGAPGLQFFELISYMNFVFITIGGVSIFATCLTEEKEEMTLGLLRMAGLNPISILLGKAVPRLVTASLLLTAQVPFTLLAITLGGVTLSQVWAAYLALLAYLCLVASIGVFSSVWCRRSSSASWMTSTILALF
ncbi:MAG: hypothetical protein ACREIV_01050, partial [Planctomycetaceae bacterium]